jgi:hypothetical protein
MVRYRIDLAKGALEKVQAEINSQKAHIAEAQAGAGGK